MAVKFTPSKNAERIAIQYLQQEFRKILDGIKEPAVWRRIDGELSSLPKKQGEASFWNLVAAIAECWKLKGVYRILSDTRFRWSRMKVPIEKIVLTGMSPTIDRYTIKKFNRNPLLFKAAWYKDRQMRRIILKTGFSAHKERDLFPILLWQADDGLRVFDGMRRVLLAIIDDKKFVPAWVGRIGQKSGKPLLSGGFGYVLSQIYGHAENKNKNLDAAMLRLGKVLSSDYRNGRELLSKRIAVWSHDQKLKKLFLKMAE